jgi:hypothetical protein
LEIIAPTGFVYIATGERYRREAATAVAQLRRTNPGARVCLVADEPGADKFWDDFVPLPDPSFSFRDKLALRLCPYARFVYLDTDTHPVSDLSEIFALLEHFDFAGHQLFEGHDSPIAGVPDAFPEFQGGVLAFRRSPALEAFFARWLALYDGFRAPGQPDRDAYANVTDQKSLRLALYESALRLAVLGPEFDFTPAHVNFACANVRILHGRGDDFDVFARRINAQLGNRVYHPILDVVLHVHTSPAELRRLWWRTTLQLLRSVGIACTPLGLRDRLRRSPTIRRLFFGGRFAP